MALVLYPTDGYDTLVTLTDADAYMASVGYSDWASASDTVRETHLRRGTQYIFARRILPDYLDPEIHGNVAAATCEAAYRSFKGTLYADVPAQAVVEKTVG